MIIGLALTLLRMTTRTSKYVLTAMLAAVVLYLGGCAPMYVLQLCPSYVVCYVNLNTVELWQEPTNPNAMIVHHGNDLPVRMYSMNSSGAEKEVYDSLCRKHNDLHYNQYRSFPKEVNDYSSVTYNCRDFLSIEVVCDKDFDEQHPAGASLCDIVRFMSWSPYKYIASGYSKYYNYNAWTLSEAFKELMPIYFSDEWFQESTSATCYPIDKMAKDLTPSDLILLGHNYPGFLGMLYFENGPRQPGEYTITVTLNCDDGYVISNSAKMRF